MNTNTAPGWAFGILNPRSGVTHRNPEGHLLATPYADSTGSGYITLADFRSLAADGFITIHKVLDNELAIAYGRVSLYYTVN